MMASNQLKEGKPGQSKGLSHSKPWEKRHVYQGPDPACAEISESFMINLSGSRIMPMLSMAMGNTVVVYREAETEGSIFTYLCLSSFFSSFWSPIDRVRRQKPAEM